MQLRKNDYLLTDDTTKVDIDTVHKLLATSYWANSRPKELIQKSIQNSICLSIFKESGQVGFARVVTDYSTFAWICDLIIDPNHRGQGLGKWMMETINSIPEIQTCNHLLRTKDAHKLYERYGYEAKECMVKIANND